MRYSLNTQGYTIREIANRLKVLNAYLPYFPPKRGSDKTVRKLSTDELIDILIRAKPTEMSIAMMKANIDPYEMTWDEILNYLERLELSTALEKKVKSEENGLPSNSSNSKKGKKRTLRTDDDAEPSSNKEEKNKKK